VTVAPTSRRLTAEEFFALDLPERHVQLVNGELVVNEPGLRHQRITAELFALLRWWTRAEPGRGEAGISVDVHLDDRNVYAPDVWWVSEERRRPRDATRIVGPPDLAVEVRSPATWRYDVLIKTRVYERAGVAELWLVDTVADTVLVYRRSSTEAAEFDVALELGRGEQVTTPLLPGLAIDLEELVDR
jgi:Uma2 family endonuclease